MSGETQRPIARKRTAGRIDCVLVAAGDWHDIDFARLELLKLLANDERIRVRVFENYDTIEAIEQADFLITYTCNLIPSPEIQQRLRDWVMQGGRWFALHGTNSILELMEGGKCYQAAESAPVMMETLGTQFLSHPEIEPYTVRVADPDHPIVADIEPFETNDELYLLRQHQPLHVLLDTEYEGQTPWFKHDKWSLSRHPVLYIKQHADGAVLYLTLGHCRHHFDMQPLMPFWPNVDRCAWDLPVFYILLERGIKWAIEPINEQSMAEFKQAKERAKNRASNK